MEIKENQKHFVWFILTKIVLWWEASTTKLETGDQKNTHLCIFVDGEYIFYAWGLVLHLVIRLFLEIKEVINNILPRTKFNNPRPCLKNHIVMGIFKDWIGQRQPENRHLCTFLYRKYIIHAWDALLHLIITEILFGTQRNFI